MPLAMQTQDEQKLAMQQRTHHFFSLEKMDSFYQLLEKPYVHFIEMREYVHLSHVLAFIENEYPHVSLSLTTDSAFKQPVADFLAALLARKKSISPSVQSDIKTCVQEAVMNAIIHGNLRIEQQNKAVASFEKYLHNVAQAVGDETLSLQRVSLFAWFTLDSVTICVADQGKGFSLEQPILNEDSPYGRGLPLIRGMSRKIWQTKPNHLYMQFSIHD